MKKEISKKRESHEVQKEGNPNEVWQKVGFPETCEGKCQGDS